MKKRLIIKEMSSDTQVKVDSSCCAGITYESHESTLKTIQMCQVKIV